MECIRQCVTRAVHSCSAQLAAVGNHAYIHTHIHTYIHHTQCVYGCMGAWVIHTHKFTCLYTHTPTIHPYKPTIHPYAHTPIRPYPYAHSHQYDCILCVAVTHNHHLRALQLHGCMGVCMCVCVYVYVCMYVCVCMCMYVCMCV